MDEAAEGVEGYEEAKKKMSHELDARQQTIDSLTSDNEKLNKSKKKVQSEVNVCCQSVAALRCGKAVQMYCQFVAMHCQLHCLYFRIRKYKTYVSNRTVLLPGSV